MNTRNRVLILCTGNSCRSQMGQVLWNEIAGDEWVAESAGSNPAGFIHPLAVAALLEVGLNPTGLRSKSTDEFLDCEFDLAVTVCDRAKDSCPVFSCVRRTLHWPFDDPAEVEGTNEEKMAVFRRVREEIKTKIRSFLSR